MTNREAQNAIVRNKGVFKYDPTMTEALDLAIKALTVEQPTGEWIPVSERLPEEHQSYLVTLKVCDTFLTSRSYFFTKEVGWSDKEVVAWMPIPKPYKGEHNNDQNDQQRSDI